MKKQAIELEELGSKIYNNVQAIVYAADMDTYELVYINAYTQEVIGAEPGKKCYQAIHNKDNPCELCPNKRLIDREGNPKKAYLWEYYNHHTGKWYEATVQALVLDDNRKIRYEIANDITHRKRDEKSLMQIIKNQRLLTEISYVFNKVDDFESKVTRALEIILSKISLSGAFIFELPKTENSNYFSVAAPNNRANTQDIILNTSKETLKTFIQNLVSKGYITNNMPDIIPRDVLSRLNNHNIHKFAFLPIMIEMDVYGILCLYQFVLNENWKDFEIDLFRTISSIYSLNYKRKLNEEEIIQSERELRQVNATKDKFFKIIAHDLKNPFTSILGYSELILRKINKIDPAKLQQFITIISTTSKSAHNLLENLLLWARSQDGSIMHNPERLELYNIIHETELLLSSSAQKKEIQLIFDVPQDVYIDADLMMINTIVRNLISNAIKFTFNNGSINVAAKTNVDWVEISVSDTGLGMKQEDIDKLFRLDIHHSTSGTENEQGTGIGLILCKEFVEKHKGTIKIESELGVGSTFKFTVPLWKE